MTNGGPAARALLCILLHASITPAQDHLGLETDSPVDLAILGTWS